MAEDRPHRTPATARSTKDAVNLIFSLQRRHGLARRAYSATKVLTRRRETARPCPRRYPWGVTGVLERAATPGPESGREPRIAGHTLCCGRRDRPAVLPTAESTPPDMAASTRTVVIGLQSDRPGRPGYLAARRARSTTSPITAPRASMSCCDDECPSVKRSEPRARASSAPMASRRGLAGQRPRCRRTGRAGDPAGVQQHQERVTLTARGKEKCAFAGNLPGPGAAPFSTASGTAVRGSGYHAVRRAARPRPPATRIPDGQRTGIAGVEGARPERPPGRRSCAR